MRLAVGYSESGKKKVAVAMTNELFNEVRLLAKDEGRSFSDMAALLIRAGLSTFRRKDDE